METETTPSSPAPVAVRWCLGVVLLLGLALRLAYASFDPTAHRFEDEQYAFLNVHSILEQGTLRPEKSYYPSPVFNLPVAALLTAGERLDPTDDGAGAAERRHRRIRREHLLARGLQAVYGALAIGLLYLIGRRLASPLVGLWAAVGLAFLPWHVHASGYFKPDALLVTAILLSLWAELRALDRPTIVRHLVVGVAIALAMSAKLTGGVVALPFAVVTLALARRDRRRLVGLVVAGIASALAFVALNPYWTNYPYYLRGLQRDYAMRAAWSDMSRLDVPLRLLEQLLGRYAHGIVFGLLALVGLVLLGASAVRRGADPALRPRRAVVVLFPLLYAAVYATQTAYFKPNNFLPVLPITTLCGAWTAVSAWRWARPRLRVGRRVLAWTATAGLAGLLVAPGTLYVYRSLTPTTWDVALEHLERRLGSATGPRFVHAERLDNPSPPWEGQIRRGRSWIAIRPSEEPASLSAQRLELADATVVAAATLRHAAGTPLDALFVGSDPALRTHFETRGIDRRGAELRLVERPWQPIGEPLRLRATRCDGSDGGCFEAVLPADLAPGDVVSLAVWARFRRHARNQLEAELDGAPLELVRASSLGNEARFVSERSRGGVGAGARLVVRGAPGGGRLRGVAIELFRWSPGTG